MSFMMDMLLCDELMIEIFHHLPKLSLSPVSLVCKRWLRLCRHAQTSLSLNLPPPDLKADLSSFLGQYPYLSSLTISTTTSTTTFAFDALLLSAASSCPNLGCLRFLCGPVSLSSLLSVSSSCHLTSLTIPLCRPINLLWVPSFTCLKQLSLIISGEDQDPIANWALLSDDDPHDMVLQLESLSVSGLSWTDLGMGWLWRNCVKLRKLHLRSCDGVGDGGSFSSFSNCLHGLRDVELRSCRSIADMVLLKLADNSTELTSLLVYDGGSKDGLLQFVNSCKSKLRRIDLRLPLDFNNEHLFAMANTFRGLSSLRLQSCCLVTDDGLKAFSTSLSDHLEELALVNCDVVERVPGLLTTLGQTLKRLRMLDLSFNEMLVDKELVSMLVSCGCLVDLKLRGCKGLTGMALVAVSRYCRDLERVDVVNCGGIEAQELELFVLNSKRLRRVHVEEHKLSNVARTWASKRFVEVVV